MKVVHDSLHMQEGLLACYCVCSSCERRWTITQTVGKTRTEVKVGKCICPDCPCDSNKNQF